MITQVRMITQAQLYARAERQVLSKGSGFSQVSLRFLSPGCPTDRGWSDGRGVAGGLGQRMCVAWGGDGPPAPQSLRGAAPAGGAGGSAGHQRGPTGGRLAGSSGE